MDLRNYSFTEIVDKTRQLLNINRNWVSQYHEYAKAILINTEQIKKKKSKFHEWSPLYLYMTIGEAKSTTDFQLRYRGQTVASLSVRTDDVYISTEGYDKNNLSNFGRPIRLKSVRWRNDEAKPFRAFFSNNPIRIKGDSKENEEHRIESLLLTEFSKTESAKKAICNIQPVTIANTARFQMRTPFKASNLRNISISKNNLGGGIDIISRIGQSRLCIMEVKDEYKTKEPPSTAMKQALIYATFIRELLRSDGGESWWQIFGFGSHLPKSLSLTVACVMPIIDNPDISFANESIKIETDRLELHYMYFKESNNVITQIYTSIPQCTVKGTE